VQDWGNGKEGLLKMQEEFEAENDISKMYFSYWKPPGVSERMWSVN
jgi:hypothetical protein